MALTLYWGSGSPFSWRVLLAMEHKGLQYESQLLHFDKQEQQSPQMLKMNPRGRVPVKSQLGLVHRSPLASGGSESLGLDTIRWGAELDQRPHAPCPLDR